MLYHISNDDGSCNKYSTPCPNQQFSKLLINNDGIFPKTKQLTTPSHSNSKIKNQKPTSPPPNHSVCQK